MTKLLEDASAWRGDELQERNDWMVNLNHQDIQEIATAVSQTKGLALEQITDASFVLPTLSSKLQSVQDSLENQSGATMIRGFPVSNHSTDESTRAFWGIVQHIGHPLSQSADGERIFHVRDAGFKPDDPRSRGPNTKKRLSFHTDRCDVIAFMCLKQAQSGGENFLVSSAAVYNEIASRRPDLLEQLCQPYYYQRHNVDAGNKLDYCRQKVFSFCENRFACSFLRVLIDRAYSSDEIGSMTELQLEALDFLEQVCEEPELQVRFFQQPGDMLLLNNWVTLHRRSEFVDHEDPDLKRHLLRIWLSVPNSRPIDSLFEDNFGATEAGAIRGGMRAVHSDEMG